MTLRSVSRTERGAEGPPQANRSRSRSPGMVRGWAPASGRSMKTEPRCWWLVPGSGSGWRSGARRAAQLFQGAAASPRAGTEGGEQQQGGEQRTQQPGRPGERDGDAGRTEDGEGRLRPVGPERVEPAGLLTGLRGAEEGGLLREQGEHRRSGGDEGGDCQTKNTREGRKARLYPAWGAGTASGRGGNGMMTTVMLSRPPESTANFARSAAASSGRVSAAGMTMAASSAASGR